MTASLPQPVTIPRTGDEISTMLTALKLPVPDRVGYLALSQTEGTRFAEAVGHAAAGCQKPQTNDYLRAMLAAVAPSTRTLLAELGFRQIDLCTLIEIASREGRSFASAVWTATSGTGAPEREGAANYIANLIDEYGSGSGIGISIDLDALPPSPAPAAPSTLPENPDARARSPRADASQSSQTPVAEPREPVKRDFAPTPGVKKSYGQSHHVYGQSAGLCFAECAVRNSEKQTVVVEIAAAEGGGINWQSKVMVMLSLADLPMVLGLFLGYLDRVELKARGRQNEKHLVMERQDKQFYVSLGVRGLAKRGVPIPAAEVYQIVAMLTRQMCRNDPHMPYAAIVGLAKHVCEISKAATQREKTGE